MSRRNEQGRSCVGCLGILVVLLVVAVVGLGYAYNAVKDTDPSQETCQRVHDLIRDHTTAPRVREYNRRQYREHCR